MKNTELKLTVCVKGPSGSGKTLMLARIKTFLETLGQVNKYEDSFYANGKEQQSFVLKTDIETLVSPKSDDLSRD